MSTKSSNIRLTVDISKKDHKMLKTASSLLGVSMRDFVLESVHERFEKLFSKESEKALRDAESGENLKKYKNLRALFRDLGI